MMNVKPRYSPYNECIENQVYTIVDSMGCINEFAYIDSIDFNFNYRKYIEKQWSTIGELIEITYDPYIMNLMRLWNIEVELRACDKDDFLTEFKKSQSHGLPLIVFLNSYWCPWEIALYKKYTMFNHAFIIHDHTSEGYKCIDGHRGLDNCFISNDDFQNGFLKKIIRFQKGPNRPDKLTWKDIVISSNMQYLSNDAQPSWKNICYFKDAITKHLDLEAEFKGLNSDYFSIKRTPLMDAIKKTKNEREKFKWCMESIRDFYSLHHFDTLNHIIEQAHYSACKWRSVSTLLLKYYYSLEKKHKIRVICLLEEIVEMEKHIYDLMKKICNLN